MDPKELKQLLKEAKENLKKNDNIGAAKACKTILKKEPDHYNANLMLGTAMREQGKSQQALEAYKKATTIEPETVYAWQGIISVHDKQGNKNHPDLLDAYKRVATFFEKEKNTQKFIENTIKLANLLISQQNVTKALKVIGRLAKSSGLNLEIAQMLVLLLNSTTSETRSKDDDELYTSALEVLVTETPQPAEETYRKFFSQLYRSGQYAKLAEKCLAIQDQWNFYYSPMEWICRLYLESQLDKTVLASTGGIEKITDKLFKLYPSSRYGYYARGKYLIEELFKYNDGFNWINNALESGYNIHAALILVRGKLKFGDYEGAMEDAAKGVANCKDDKLAGKRDFELIFELLYLEALIGTDSNESLELQRLKLEAIFKTNPDSPHLLPFLELSIRTKLKKRDFADLDKLLAEIESSPHVQTIPAWKLAFYTAIKDGIAQNDVPSFVKSCLSTYPENSEMMLEAGIFLHDFGDYQAAADILSNLVATKEGKNHPHTWKYLGKLAILEGELEKATRLLKKSYDLNLDSEVGSTLVDIYQEIGQIGLKKALLLDASRKVRKTKSKWVWSRLGLMYLEEEDWLKAVECLQSAIRVDLTDGFLWESLADAYFYRGSLQAALRCYNKALENGVDPTYPKMRIGTIYQLSEEEDKAVGGLTELLQEKPDDSPLQLELAQLFCWVASEKVKDNFDRGALSAVEKGLACVVKAVMHSTKPMLLPWIIIGEYTIILNNLPEATSIRVPSLLVQSQGQDINLEKVLDNEVISLQQFKEIGSKALLQCLQTISSTNIDTQSGELFGYIYHQLALSFSNRSQLSTMNEKEKKLCLMTALQYCKKAIAKSQQNSIYWNTMSIISTRLGDFQLSQHCLVRALNADTNNVVAWGNLGMLYYNQYSFLLSHKAFSKGQSVAPVYANSWIGQALVAEQLQPSESADLFRHACLLRPHPFAVSSYGNDIVSLLTNPDEFKKDMSPEDYRYVRHHLLSRMEAVSHLNDLITRVENRMPSQQLYNLKGIIAGWNGFYETSLESFTKALEATPGLGITEGNSDQFKIFSNRISLLVVLEKYEDARAELMKMPTLDCIGLTNAALALYKLNEPNTAIDMYNRILALPDIEKKKADAKIAIALLMNVTAGVDEAKTILFGKDLMKNPRSLLTLAAIAVTHNDLKLLKAVLQELKPYQWSSELVADITLMKVCFEILQSSFKKAVKVILHAIHMHPTNARLYALGSQVMISYNLENLHVSLPRHFALCTLKLSRIMGTSREDGIFASKHSGIVSLTHLLEYNFDVAVSSTMKAIRCYPEQRDNWAVLACAYWVRYSKTGDILVLKKVVDLLDREVKLGLCSPRVKEWMESFGCEIAQLRLKSRA